ncbi:MAG: hypothetical protein COW65_19475 [Cytophagales bacterium CG18_big_fil_WC_8_21_14_2_50_42_9]|nr:MAG: hypothetical protein COW65_19475 [Cytophagales bacterium CG18_big_fil_WC_8_21_14_2_50_42_9]
MKNPLFENLVACIVNNNSNKFSEILKKNPIDLNSKDGKGWTLLHYAAQYLTVEIGQILISGGADVNTKDNFGNNI